VREFAPRGGLALGSPPPPVRRCHTSRLAPGRRACIMIWLGM
jgi:hypothetical protein